MLLLRGQGLSEIEDDHLLRNPARAAPQRRFVRRRYAAGVGASGHCAPAGDARSGIRRRAGEAAAEENHRTAQAGYSSDRIRDQRAQVGEERQARETREAVQGRRTASARGKIGAGAAAMKRPSSDLESTRVRVPRAERVEINHEFASVEEFIHEYVTNVSRSGIFIKS